MNVEDYIELFFKSAKLDDEKTYSLEYIIDNNDFVIILGNPGSGKTTMLTNYQVTHSESVQYITINDFLLLETLIDENTQLLLLDAMDEYRNSPEKNKSFVPKQIGDKISKKCPNLRIIITCREMDWYGEKDKEGLSKYLSKEISIFKVCQLNDEQKEELAIKLIKNSDPDKFIRKFDSFGFLENPQTFTMLAEIFESGILDVTSKIELFQKYIYHLYKETNEDNQRNDINEIEKDTFIRCAGYFACFYFFTNSDKFDSMLNEITDKKNGFEKKDLETTLKSRLFNEKTFIHRTLAEFLSASFLTELLNKNHLLLTVENIKTMFAPKGVVPTDLRGTFSWLCSLTKNETFIKIDPYYQIIHGDNTLFNVNLKKKVILAIKEYAITHPYFFYKNNAFELDGIYDEKLNGFLFKEIKDSLTIVNHYPSFLVNIVSNSKCPSDIIKNNLRKLLLESDKKIEPFIAIPIVKILNDETATLNNILKRILKGELDDSFDGIKDDILELLVPYRIDKNELTEYLFSYQQNVGGHCWYLLDQEYDYKEQLVGKLYEYRNSLKDVEFPDNVKYFIDDFYAETITKYKNSLSLEDIYDKLENARSKYLKGFERIEFSSYIPEICDLLKKEAMNELANDLFSLYIERNIKNAEITSFRYEFSKFFSFKTPTNSFSILLKKINPNNLIETNKILFRDSFGLKKKNEIDTDVNISSIAQKYELQDALKEYVDREPYGWEIEAEKEKEKKEEQQKEILINNEKKFSIPDKEILNSVDRLYFISKILHLWNPDKIEYFNVETMSKLKDILSTIPFKPIAKESANLKEFTKSLTCHRKIDLVYFVATLLNEKFDLDRLFEQDDALIQYIYVNAVLRRHKYLNFDKGNFMDVFEQKKYVFAVDAIKAFSKEILYQHLSEYQDIYTHYISNENSLKKLQQLIDIDLSNKKTLLNDFMENFLKIYNFSIEKETLDRFFENKSTIDNKSTVQAIQAIKSDDEDSFTRTLAISTYNIIKTNGVFESLDSKLKLRVSNYMLNQFNTEDSIAMKSGFQALKDECVEFLRDRLLSELELSELNELREQRENKQDAWTNRICHKIYLLERQDCDNGNFKFTIEQLKKLLNSSEIISSKMFFSETNLRLTKLKEEIEANRISEKNSFWNEIKGEEKHKTENECRDYLSNLLKREYKDLVLNREQAESENFVDINFKYKPNPSFEIQVECKGDWHSELFTGIKNQLIKKYLGKGIDKHSKPKYGIYLVFYTGEKGKQIDELQKEIEGTIPCEYINNIKVVCIDITRPSTRYSRLTL